jgi:hypothetical protein
MRSVVVVPIHLHAASLIGRRSKSVPGAFCRAARADNAIEIDQAGKLVRRDRAAIRAAVRPRAVCSGNHRRLSLGHPRDVMPAAFSSQSRCSARAMTYTPRMWRSSHRQAAPLRSSRPMLLVTPSCPLRAGLALPCAAGRAPSITSRVAGFCAARWQGRGVVRPWPVGRGVRRRCSSGSARTPSRGTSVGPRTGAPGRARSSGSTASTTSCVVRQRKLGAAFISKLVRVGASGRVVARVRNHPRLEQGRELAALEHLADACVDRDLDADVALPWHYTPS